MVKFIGSIHYCWSRVGLHLCSNWRNVSLLLLGSGVLRPYSNPSRKMVSWPAVIGPPTIRLCFGRYTRNTGALSLWRTETYSRSRVFSSMLPICVVSFFYVILIHPFTTPTLPSTHIISTHKFTHFNQFNLFDLLSNYGHSLSEWIQGVCKLFHSQTLKMGNTWKVKNLIPPPPTWGWGIHADAQKHARQEAQTQHPYQRTLQISILT
jgi:hypothetical protein